jgi:YgiT-type zinc finger domain-containing protein
MNEKKSKCPFCGGQEFEHQHTDYLYSRDGQYLLAPDIAVEVCVNCGMVFYEGGVLEEIERQFFAIYEKAEKADQYIQIPVAVDI